MKKKYLFLFVVLFLVGCGRQTPVEKAVSSCTTFIQTLSIQTLSFEIPNRVEACGCFVEKGKEILEDKEFNIFLNAMIGKKKLIDFSKSIEDSYSSGDFPLNATNINIHFMECW